MGLDTVELVMEFEETFGITIPNRDAESLLTIGDVVRYVLSRVEISRSAPCLTAWAFYRLRRALIVEASAERGRVRPGASLEDLLPRRHRRTLWVRLGRAADVPLPPLVLPGPVRVGFFAALFVWVVGTLPALAASAVGRLDVYAACSWILGGFPLIVGVYALAEQFAAELAPEFRLVGGLARSVARALSVGTDESGAAWTEETVRLAIFRVVSEQMGVSGDRLTDDTHFVYDLGAD